MNRLKELRLSRKLKQSELAQILDIAQPTLSGWETERYQIDDNSKVILAKFFNVSLDYLMGNSFESSAPSAAVRVPVLGSVHAGIPMEAITDILDYEDIPASMAKNGEYFGLRIKGDSMSPRICDGDTVIVRKQDTVKNGEVAIVLVNGDEATVKEVQVSNFGITLVGWNVSVYSPHFYPIDEVENLPVRIIGRVVELRGKF